MGRGDKIAYYVTGVKAFAGVATITSAFYEDHAPIWTSSNKKNAGEDYPFRVRIEPDVILDESDFVPAEGIARRMIYASKWPAANWTLAFQGNVHSIPAEDYELIREALTHVSAAT
jgi:predicted RNA-binding protein